MRCGVDVGGTKILAVAVDTDLEPARVPTPRGGPAIADAIVGLVGTLTAAAPDDPLTGVGLGIPGLVTRGGLLRVGPNLPGVVDYPFATELSTRLGARISVDNDANCATWGEHQRGAARGASDAVMVTLGTGIGAGIVSGGVLQRGANGFAAEAGHMVVDPHGPPCPCGRRGCWERYASGSGLGQLGRAAALARRASRIVALAGGDPESVHGEHVTRAAAEGDPEAVDVLAQFAWWVALGIANIVDLLDPEVVVVGGGLAAAGDLLLDPLRAVYPSLVLAADHRPPARIVAAELGESAGAIGAALLAPA